MPVATQLISRTSAQTVTPSKVRVILPTEHQTTTACTCSLHMLSAFDQAQRETNINGKRGKGNNASDITNHGKGIRLLCWNQTHPATIKYIVYGKRDCSGDASKVLISTWGVAYFFTLSLVFLNLNKNDINIVPRIDQGGLLRDC